MISPSMERPVLLPTWMLREGGLEPAMQDTAAPWSGLPYAGDSDKSATRSSDLNLDAILTTCVEGMVYRQFHVELLKKLLQQLHENAATVEDREKIDTLFHKTFLGCVIKKSKYLRDLAETLLDEQEFNVFMAFQDPATTTQLVAKALERTEEEVVTIFISAQTKISSITGGNSKSNLS